MLAQRPDHSGDERGQQRVCIIVTLVQARTAARAASKNKREKMQAAGTAVTNEETTVVEGERGGALMTAQRWRASLKNKRHTHAHVHLPLCLTPFSLFFYFLFGVAPREGYRLWPPMRIDPFFFFRRVTTTVFLFLFLHVAVVVAIALIP
jgi:hypothetical protein